MQQKTPQKLFDLGARGSPLSLTQARQAQALLAEALGLAPAERDARLPLAPITTSGDQMRDKPLSAFGGKGLFTKEIDEALLGRHIDIAVHSMKDLPTALPAGIALACVLPREDPRDALVAPSARAIADLPNGARIGTASLRRGAQVRRLRPDLETVMLRGNVQTRLHKIRNGAAEATFLAMAGLKRLGKADAASTPIETDEMLPAIAQGAIALTARADDVAALEACAALDCAKTALRTTAERGFLAALDGSCRTPIAGLAEYSDGVLHLRGEILSPDGTQCFSSTAQSPMGLEDKAAAHALGRRLGEDLRQQAGPDFFRMLEEFGL